MSRGSSFLGTLGDRMGVNVARVDVSWGWDDSTEVETGHYHVHATGEEPESVGEDGTIYAIFEKHVQAAMDARQEKLGFDWWETEDTRSV
jgi:hypothetical protein